MGACCSDDKNSITEPTSIENQQKQEQEQQEEDRFYQPPPEAGARRGTLFQDTKIARNCGSCQIKLSETLSYYSRSTITNCRSCGLAICKNCYDKASTWCEIPSSSSSSCHDNNDDDETESNEKGLKSTKQLCCTLCSSMISQLSAPQNVTLQLFHLSVLGVYSLTAQDKKNLSQIKRLPTGFLSAIQLHRGDPRLALPNVQHVDFSIFTSLEDIGGSLCWGMKNLESVNFTGCSKVRTISNSFLWGTSLEDGLDLSPFSAPAGGSLKVVNKHFLRSVTKLNELDVSFLAGCDAFCADFFLFDNHDSCKLINLHKLAQLVEKKRINGDGVHDEQNSFEWIKAEIGKAVRDQKRREAILSIALISHKSNESKLAQLFCEEWVAKKLVFLYLA